MLHNGQRRPVTGSKADPCRKDRTIFKELLQGRPRSDPFEHVKKDKVDF
jgi:hypothetical protein